VKYLDKFQALIQLKDANAAAQTKLVSLFSYSMVKINFISFLAFTWTKYLQWMLHSKSKTDLMNSFFIEIKI
jgi:hypothetical protein